MRQSNCRTTDYCALNGLVMPSLCLYWTSFMYSEGRIGSSSRWMPLSEPFLSRLDLSSLDGVEQSIWWLYFLQTHLPHLQHVFCLKLDPIWTADLERVCNVVHISELPRSRRKISWQKRTLPQCTFDQTWSRSRCSCAVQEACGRTPMSDSSHERICCTLLHNVAHARAKWAWRDLAISTLRKQSQVRPASFKKKPPSERVRWSSSIRSSTRRRKGQMERQKQRACWIFMCFLEAASSVWLRIKQL